MMVTSRQPSFASCATMSRHSSVESSSVLALPAREPQWLQARSHFRVISQTAYTGLHARRSSSDTARARVYSLPGSGVPNTNGLPLDLAEGRERALEVAERLVRLDLRGAREG